MTFRVLALKKKKIKSRRRIGKSRKRKRCEKEKEVRGENCVECVDIKKFTRMCVCVCVCVRLKRKGNRTIQNRIEQMYTRTYHLLFLEQYGQVSPTLHLLHHRLIHPQCDRDLRHVVLMLPKIIIILDGK